MTLKKPSGPGVKKTMKKYNIKYSCGCVHEIKEEKGLHEATGNNKNYKEHK